MGRVVRAGAWVAFNVLAASASRAQKPGTSALVATVAVDSSRVLLPGAEVVITDLHRVNKSDLLGEAIIPNVPLGEHGVRVRALGYAPVEARLLFRGDSLVATFYLQPIAKTMDAVRVSAKRVSRGLEQFEARRAMGLGRFLTEHQLDSASTPDFYTLMSTRFPGLTVIPLADGERTLASTRGSCGADASRIAGRRGSVGGGGTCFSNTPCAVPVFLDGQDLHEAVDDIVRIWDLAGVEFYSGSQVPAEYRASGSACGVLVLWSRRN